ncbi:hypothetical protein K490DRAFT_68715 [Saccharata proteae CBS 121410]|uniref:Uncharacterized protein n=1 Tax=Saccharata proteae CBS 121410 TaxID=1314787 RepID=A0A9P4HPQ1_9PEZI|nr:hypothetical protein K490DRAFT_68715 [Saccharata proteae CBS 121410]
MPTADRHNHATANGKPLRPTLASSRTSKTPLTPKLAASAPPTSAPASSTVTPRLAVREDTSSYFNNITPRSSSRRSRTGSGHASPSGSTPNLTPSSARHSSTIDDDRASSVSGSHVSSSRRPRSIIGGNGVAHTGLTMASSSSDVGGRDHSAMFFHASDVRTNTPEHSHTVPSKKPTPFLYASRNHDRPPPASSTVSSPPVASLERTHSQPKFFHADSTPETKSPLQSPPMIPAPTSEPFPPLRSPSPHKDTIHLSYRKGASQVMRPGVGVHRPSAASMLSGISESRDGPISRRTSSADHSANRTRHGKSSSVSSIDTVASNRRVSNSAVENAAAAVPSPLQIDISSPTTVSPSEVSRVSRSRDGEKVPSGLQSPLSMPQSPTQPVNPGQKNPLQHMNELAANARRERKVLDLEISNSSLLAINRQLEREVRKQKAELRRFRRMTRAGGVSAPETVRSSLVPLSEGETAEFLPDSGDEEEADEDEEGSALSSDSSFDEGAMSPNALAERDAKYREQDQKRLHLDLSKHQELLVDSQKMNQSLKRCLGWSEEMIKEGKKALEYRVRVSDIKLGGRILSADEQSNSGDLEDEDEEQRSGGSLLSPWTRPEHDTRTSLESERTDRDSGIELDGPKLPAGYFDDDTAGRASDGLGETF